MSLRISSLLVLTASLTACGVNASEEPDGPTIDCAIGPGADLASVCTLEIIASDEFVIHHPDGGFRRFIWTDDGVLAASDGAEQVVLVNETAEADKLEFEVTTDRYSVDSALVPQPGND